MTETDILCSEYKLFHFTDTIYAIFLKTGTGMVIFFGILFSLLPVIKKKTV